MKDRKNRNIIIASSVSCLILGGLLAIYVIPPITKAVSAWDNNELLTAITIVGVIVALCVPYMEYRFDKKLHAVDLLKSDERMQTLYQIDLHVSTLPNNTVLFSASIENVGDKLITMKASNLYIDQGISVNKGSNVMVNGNEEIGAVYYEFPFILQHLDVKNEKHDCILCTKCKAGDLSYPTDGLKDRFKGEKLYRANIELEHLSEKSILYIKPKERFSEDVVLQIKNSGVYRVTFVVTTDGDADCECATKQFYIPKSLPKSTGGSPE
jgi:hypothetical protein